MLDGPLILWANLPVVDTCTINPQSKKFVIGVKVKVTTFYTVGHCYLNLPRDTMYEKLHSKRLCGFKVTKFNSNQGSPMRETYMYIVIH